MKELGPSRNIQWYYREDHTKLFGYDLSTGKFVYAEESHWTREAEEQLGSTNIAGI